MADSQVTAWDEGGKPIQPNAGGVTAWDENGNPIGADSIAQQSKAAAISAGVQNPGVSMPPLKPAMEAAGARHEANETRLDELKHRAMQSPTPVTKAAMALFPAAELPSAIASGGLKAVGGTIARGLAKSALGSSVGAGAGAGLGRIISPEASKTGAEIGATVGGMASPFLPNRVFARIPGGGALLSNEELAAERAAMKIAQRGADIKAGFRKAPTPIREITPKPMPVGTSTSAPPTFQGELPPAGSVPQPKLALPTTDALGSYKGQGLDKAPLRPEIGTPEEWATYDQRMKNLKAEAKDAGTYSAARGKAGEKLNYQKRIGQSF